MSEKNGNFAAQNLNDDCMKKILLFVVALVSLTISAQNLEHVFDMDALAASKE